MQDDLILISGFDGDNLSSFDEKSILERVQFEINLAADNRDAQRAVEICDYFYTATKLAGKALAKALYTFYLRWREFGIGEDFLDYINGRIALARHTVERYLRVAELLEKVPDEYRDQVERKGIGQLIPIANALAQDIEIANTGWEAIIGATNYYEVQQVVNNIKGVEPRESALSIRLNRDGSIVVYKGGDGPHFVGSLETESQNELVRAAIERITRNAGVLSV